MIKYNDEITAAYDLIARQEGEPVELGRLSCIAASHFELDAEDVEKCLAAWVMSGKAKTAYVGAHCYVFRPNINN